MLWALGDHNPREEERHAPVRCPTVCAQGRAGPTHLVALEQSLSLCTPTMFKACGFFYVNTILTTSIKCSMGSGESFLQ